MAETMQSLDQLSALKPAAAPEAPKYVQKLDKQGRVGIPATLKEYARLERDVVVAGVHDHLEIWDRGAWRRELAEVEGSAEHVAERLAAKRD